MVNNSVKWIKIIHNSILSYIQVGWYIAYYCLELCGEHGCRKPLLLLVTIAAYWLS